jgi:hypothetical protein
MAEIRRRATIRDTTPANLVIAADGSTACVAKAGEPASYLSN